ncbi:MAG: LysR substrate-binding domain-containing protein, partial [Pseudomonadota bacterium]
YHPPRMTDDGLRLVDHARQMLTVADDIRAIGEADTLVGSVTIGVVPSALVRLMPPALARLRAAHPRLDIQIRSGLSEQLLADVLNRDLDVALVTEPEVVADGMISALICREPLDVIASTSVTQTSITAILTQNPFIWFSRRTLTGQQIEQHLRHRKLVLKTAMEIDSIEAIESLVANGFGVSVSPRRTGFTTPDPKLRRISFQDPPLSRGLSLISLERNPRKRVLHALRGELQHILA